MPDKPKYYLTTPIYYTNGLPHIGHTYSTIVCDTIRRYKRMRGYDVVMTTGTDEHGVNVERSAKKAGVPESEFVAKMAAEWRALWDELGVQGDEFIRTTDLKHAHTVQWLFKLCRENGFVYPGHYTGQYCIHDNAYVDVKPGENCPDCGRPTETVTEANFFFKLSAFQKRLLDWYAKHPEFIQPESRRNEILSFVEGGLRDLSITRTSIRWGIPVPGEDVRYDTLLHTALADISDVCNYYDVFNFSRALERIWNLISEVDKYLVLQQPWTLAEDPPQREKLARILYGAAETLRIVSALAHPFIPESTQKIWTLLGYKTNLTLLSLDELTWGQLKPGTPIGKIEAVFPRIDKAEAIERMEAMEKEEQKQPSPVTAPAAKPASASAAGGAAAAAASQTAPEKIGIDDFSKVEMRVGQIKTAERIVGADKLLKLTVDIGTEIRQICAGI